LENSAVANFLGDQIDEYFPVDRVEVLSQVSIDDLTKHI